MRRLLAFVLLVVLAVAAATVADYPGTVEIAWQGWQIDTSFGVLVAALAAAAIALWLVFLLIGGLVRLPRHFRRNRRERRRRAGELALTRGMTALSTGDAAGAQRYASRAETLLGITPLVLMLSAQAAELGGDEDEARRRYTALLDEKEAAFFGLRGLIGQALRDDEGEDALRLAARARALRPDAEWGFETLFALQTQSRRWEEARETLADGARRHLLPATRAEHHRGVIAHELSRAAERDGEQRRAIALVATADSLVHDIAAPAVRHASLLIAQKRNRAARRVVEQAWQRSPHPDLALVWGELGGATPALEVVTWFEKLAAHNPASMESAVAVAEAALAAQLWGEARRHLGRAGAAQADGPSRRICLLMARLEDSEHPQENRAREWFDRALTAPPDPTYVCTRCGVQSAEWEALCGHCHGFDTFAWRTPWQAMPLGLPEAARAAPLLSMPGELGGGRRAGLSP